jgi:hypothetical protein
LDVDVDVDEYEDEDEDTELIGVVIRGIQVVARQMVWGGDALNSATISGRSRSRYRCGL